MSKRKLAPPILRGSTPRPVVPASPRGGTAAALRAVAVLALATAGCEHPREWPGEIKRGAERAGRWIGVLDEPRSLAGEQAVVHPMPSSSAPATK